jgi:hypothetical protein
MGLFNFFKKKVLEKESFMSEEEKLLNGDSDGNEVIVSLHVNEAKEKIMKKAVVENVFAVTGVYDIGTEVMISGKVQSGVLKKKMKIKINDKESVLLDLKQRSSSVKELNSGEDGTVFLKGKNLFLVKVGDILKFK